MRKVFARPSEFFVTTKGENTPQAFSLVFAQSTVSIESIRFELLQSRMVSPNASIVPSYRVFLRCSPNPNSLTRYGQTPLRLLFMSIIECLTLPTATEPRSSSGKVSNRPLLTYERGAVKRSYTCSEINVPNLILMLVDASSLAIPLITKDGNS
jgi:hypothetical protein